MNLIKKRLKLLIVGAKFGETYLNAFLFPNPEIELVGLFSKGSQRSQQLAHSFGITLYTNIDQIPKDIDIACVVVRSTVVGGDGTALVKELLERGIHVVQEHPVHPDDVIRLQKIATNNKCLYWINSCYIHTLAGQCWIENAQRIRKLLDGKSPHFANFTTSRQLLYSSLDLLLQACGENDATIGISDNEEEPFSLLYLDFSNFSAVLRLQKYMNPKEDDFHNLVMHKLTLGWPSGYLSLEATYGPVLWTSSLHDKNNNQNKDSLYLRCNKKGNEFLSTPITTTLHSTSSTWSEAFEINNPLGVTRVLNLLISHLNGNDVPAAFNSHYQLSLTKLWQKILRHVGSATEYELPEPQVIHPEDLINK